MPLKAYQDDPPELNLTPMIDVVFLLIIFFMVGTKFTEPEDKIALKIPQVPHAAASQPMPMKKVVQVERDGSLLLDGQRLELPALTSELHTAVNQNPGLSVTVHGDAEGAFQNVASVLSACQKAGVQEMAISVKIVR